MISLASEFTDGKGGTLGAGFFMTQSADSALDWRNGSRRYCRREESR